LVVIVSEEIKFDLLQENIKIIIIRRISTNNILYKLTTNFYWYILMTGHTGISRESVLRKRTPHKRDKKERKEKKEKEYEQESEDSIHESTPRKEKEKEKKKKIVSPLKYMTSFQKNVNDNFDELWKNRSTSEYVTGMIVKINILIEQYGWKWWLANDELDNNAFKIRLTELYQFIISVYLKNKKNIIEPEVRPETLSSNLFKEMLRSALDEDLEKLYETIHSIAIELKFNISMLNTVMLVSRHVRSLSGYIRGQYRPHGYVDNDVELTEHCCENITSYNDLVNNVYDFYSIPTNERLINNV
jgi:hypothetical protein